MNFYRLTQVHRSFTKTKLSLVTHHSFSRPLFYLCVYLYRFVLFGFLVSILLVLCFSFHLVSSLIDLLAGSLFCITLLPPTPIAIVIFALRSFSQCAVLVYEMYIHAYLFNLNVCTRTLLPIQYSFCQLIVLYFFLHLVSPFDIDNPS
jgi:hypothetical protein